MTVPSKITKNLLTYNIKKHFPKRKIYRGCSFLVRASKMKVPSCGNDWYKQWWVIQTCISNGCWVILFTCRAEKKLKGMADLKFLVCDPGMFVILNSVQLIYILEENDITWLSWMLEWVRIFLNKRRKNINEILRHSFPYVISRAICVFLTVSSLSKEPN